MGDLYKEVRVGLTTLNLDPERIRILDYKHVTKSVGLRSNLANAVSTGMGDFHVEMGVRFEGGDINSHLRELIAQCYGLPFIPIKSEVVAKNIVDSLVYRFEQDSSDLRQQFEKLSEQAKQGWAETIFTRLLHASIAFLAENTGTVDKVMLKLKELIDEQYFQNGPLTIEGITNDNNTAINAIARQLTTPDSILRFNKEAAYIVDDGRAKAGIKKAKTVDEVANALRQISTGVAANVSRRDITHVSRADVVGVLDGDTIYVQYTGDAPDDTKGNNRNIRLVGIDAFEVGHYGIGKILDDGSIGFITPQELKDEAQKKVVVNSLGWVSNYDPSASPRVTLSVDSRENIRSIASELSSYSDNWQIMVSAVDGFKKLSGQYAHDGGFAAKAQKWLKSRVAGRNITLLIYGYDVFGRPLAEIIDENGENVNLEMVREGLVFPTMLEDIFITPQLSYAYLSAAKEAIDSGNGIWGSEGDYFDQVRTHTIIPYQVDGKPVEGLAETNKNYTGIVLPSIWRRDQRRGDIVPVALAKQPGDFDPYTNIDSSSDLTNSIIRSMQVADDKTYRNVTHTSLTAESEAVGREVLRGRIDRAFIENDRIRVNVSNTVWRFFADDIQALVDLANQIKLSSQVKSNKLVETGGLFKDYWVPMCFNGISFRTNGDLPNCIDAVLNFTYFNHAPYVPLLGMIGQSPVGDKSAPHPHKISLDPARSDAVRSWLFKTFLSRQYRFDEGKFIGTYDSAVDDVRIRYKVVIPSLEIKAPDKVTQDIKTYQAHIANSLAERRVKITADSISGSEEKLTIGGEQLIKKNVRNAEIAAYYTQAGEMVIPDMTPIHIVCSYRNNIPNIPIQGDQYPTAMFTGRGNAEVELTYKTRNIDSINQLKMVDYSIQEAARNAWQDGFNFSTVEVDHPAVSMIGAANFVPGEFQFDTDPEQPGWFIVRLNLIESDRDVLAEEELKPIYEGLTIENKRALASQIIDKLVNDYMHGERTSTRENAKNAFEQIIGIRNCDSYPGFWAENDTMPIWAPLLSDAIVADMLNPNRGADLAVIDRAFGLNVPANPHALVFDNGKGSYDYTSAVSRSPHIRLLLGPERDSRTNSFDYAISIKNAVSSGSWDEYIAKSKQNPDYWEESMRRLGLNLNNRDRSTLERHLFERANIAEVLFAGTDIQSFVWERFVGTKYGIKSNRALANLSYWGAEYATDIHGVASIFSRKLWELLDNREGIDRAKSVLSNMLERALGYQSFLEANLKWFDRAALLSEFQFREFDDQTHSDQYLPTYNEAYGIIGSLDADLRVTIIYQLQAALATAHMSDETIDTMSSETLVRLRKNLRAATKDFIALVEESNEPIENTADGRTVTGMLTELNTNETQRLRAPTELLPKAGDFGLIQKDPNRRIRTGNDKVEAGWQYWVPDTNVKAVYDLKPEAYAKFSEEYYGFKDVEDIGDEEDYFHSLSHPLVRKKGALMVPDEHILAGPRGIDEENVYETSVQLVKSGGYAATHQWLRGAASRAIIDSNYNKPVLKNDKHGSEEQQRTQVTDGSTVVTAQANRDAIIRSSDENAKKDVQAVDKPKRYRSIKNGKLLDKLPNGPKGCVPGTGRRFGNTTDPDTNASIQNISRAISDLHEKHVWSMKRAFPTYALYFIEENKPGWGYWDDRYRYDSVLNITVTDHKYEPALCELEITNYKGILSGYLDGKKGPTDVVHSQVNNAPHQGSAFEPDRKRLEAFVLKAGTRIMVRLGYSSRADELETTFTGQVAEVITGDTIKIIAQGYDYQLMRPLRDSWWTGTDSFVRIISHMLSEVNYFGDWQLYKDRLHVKPQRAPSLVEGILGLNNTTNDNLWFDNGSAFGHFWEAISSQHWTVAGPMLENIYTMTRYMPNYVCATRPLDTHATLFFGRPDYWYISTARPDLLEVQRWNYNTQLQNNAGVAGVSVVNSTLARDQSVRREFIVDSPNNSMTATLSNGRPAVFSSWAWKSEQQFNEFVADINRRNLMIDVVDRLNPLILALVFQDAAFANDPMKELTRIKGFDNKEPNMNLVEKPKQALLNWLRSDVPVLNPAEFAKDRPILYRLIRSKLSPDIHDYGFSVDVWRAQTLGYTYDLDTAKSYHAHDKVAPPDLGFAAIPFPDTIGKVGGGDPTATKRKVLMMVLGILENLDSLIPSDGSLGELYYNSRVAYSTQPYPPNMRPFRNYHYATSPGNILSNTIVATRAHMGNTAVLHSPEDASKFVEKGMHRVPTEFSTTTCNIAPEDRLLHKLITEFYDLNASTQHENAQIAMSCLGEALRPMYRGQLNLLGNEKVKPYDIIRIDDHYHHMHGVFEVERVVHHFSHQTGYITSITPHLLVHVARDTDFWLSVFESTKVSLAGYAAITGGIGLGFLTGGGVGGAMYTIGGAVGANLYSSWWREAPSTSILGIPIPAITGQWMIGPSRLNPVRLTPLSYKGVPYTAGLEGWNRFDWKGKWQDQLTNRRERRLGELQRGFNRIIDLGHLYWQRLEATINKTSETWDAIKRSE